MNDDKLRQLLKQNDAHYRAAMQRERAPVKDHSAFLTEVRERRARQVRRRIGVGTGAAVMALVALAMWSINRSMWQNSYRIPSGIASQGTKYPKVARQAGDANVPATVRQLSAGEIVRLKAEIASSDAEANRARRFVELYRAAESRRERLAAVEEDSSAEPLLPPAALARLEIDRAAAITVTSADSLVNQFHQAGEAAESYRTVITLFPDSRWAGIARERLDAMEGMN